MKLDKKIADRKNKAIYQDGDKCVKIFDEQYSKADILNEALNQARVEETSLSIPKVVEVTKIDGKWAIVLEYIKGKTLQQLMEENPAKQGEYLDKFVAIQTNMHKQKCPMLNKWKDKMNRKITACGLEATIRYELHMRLEGMPLHNKLCHGDMNPSNIIVGDDGKDYILDWAHATQGNGSADAARTYLLFSLTDEKLAEAYLEKYCDATDTAKQYVIKWLPIVAASQLVKGKEEEKETLMKWASIMDFE